MADARRSSVSSGKPERRHFKRRRSRGLALRANRALRVRMQEENIRRTAPDVRTRVDDVLKLMAYLLILTAIFVASLMIGIPGTPQAMPQISADDRLVLVLPASSTVEQYWLTGGLSRDETDDFGFWLSVGFTDATPQSGSAYLVAVGQGTINGLRSCLDQLNLEPAPVDSQEVNQIISRMPASYANPYSKDMPKAQFTYKTAAYSAPNAALSTDSCAFPSKLSTVRTPEGWNSHAPALEVIRGSSAGVRNDGASCLEFTLSGPPADGSIDQLYPPGGPNQNAKIEDESYWQDCKTSPISKTFSAISVRYSTYATRTSSSQATFIAGALVGAGCGLIGPALKVLISVLRPVRPR